MPANNHRHCQFPGCEKIGVESKELCLKHYRLMRRDKIQHLKLNCTAANCQSKVYAKSLCHKHYERIRRRGELEPVDLRYTAAPEIDGLKVCRRCRLLRPLDDFNVDKRPDRCLVGRQGWCRNCFKTYKSERNAAKIANGLCLHCEEPAIHGTTICRSHLQYKKQYEASPYGKAKQILRGALARAKKYGLICTIDQEWIIRKLRGNCELTGIPFDLRSDRKIGKFNPYAPSIDRVIAGSHYTKENCRMVIMAINAGMNAWGEEIYCKVAKAYLVHNHHGDSDVMPRTEIDDELDSLRSIN